MHGFISKGGTTPAKAQLYQGNVKGSRREDNLQSPVQYSMATTPLEHSPASIQPYSTQPPSNGA